MSTPSVPPALPLDDAKAQESALTCQVLAEAIRELVFWEPDESFTDPVKKKALVMKINARIGALITHHTHIAIKVNPDRVSYDVSLPDVDGSQVVTRAEGEVLILNLSSPIDRQTAIERHIDSRVAFARYSPGSNQTVPPHFPLPRGLNADQIACIDAQVGQRIASLELGERKLGCAVFKWFIMGLAVFLAVVYVLTK